MDLTLALELSGGRDVVNERTKYRLHWTQKWNAGWWGSYARGTGSEYIGFSNADVERRLSVLQPDLRNDWRIEGSPNE